MQQHIRLINIPIVVVVAVVVVVAAELGAAVVFLILNKYNKQLYVSTIKIIPRARILNFHFVLSNFTFLIVFQV